MKGLKSIFCIFSVFIFILFSNYFVFANNSSSIINTNINTNIVNIENINIVKNKTNKNILGMTLEELEYKVNFGIYCMFIINVIVFITVFYFEFFYIVDFDEQNELVAFSLGFLIITFTIIICIFRYVYIGYIK